MSKLRPPLPYLSAAEKLAFDAGRAKGTISFFRIKHCVCGKEIPKAKDFCSKNCYQALMNRRSELRKIIAETIEKWRTEKSKKR